MGKGRLEAFSDGVFAIIITIMVLEIKAPETGDFTALLSQLPTFISYVLSFIYVGIYWNNHHHMFQLAEHVNGRILWANLHLLFWLTLVPFTTAWMGNTHFAQAPMAVYGLNLLTAAIAYVILQKAILKENGKESKMAKALGNKWKENLSPVLYLSGIAVAFLNSYISAAFYVAVALIWLIPDKRIEKAFRS